MTDLEATLALDPTFWVEPHHDVWAVCAGWMGTPLAFRATEGDAWSRAHEIAKAKHVTYAARSPAIPLAELAPPAADPVAA